MNKRAFPRLISSLSATVLLVLLSACEEKNTESVADELVGNWATVSPIPFIVKTDFCTGTLEEVGREEWSMEWEIKKTSDEHIVDISMTYYRSGFTVTNTDCSFGTGYVPEPSPMFLKGHITGQTVAVWYGDDEIGSVDILDKELDGDLAFGYCLIYCQEITCDPGDSIHLKKL
ncbi:hypothetical protein ACFL45_03275 [Candidatus Neomarinimicrobiota bacterium]